MNGVIANCNRSALCSARVILGRPDRSGEMIWLQREGLPFDHSADRRRPVVRVMTRRHHNDARRVLLLIVDATGQSLPERNVCSVEAGYGVVASPKPRNRDARFAAGRETNISRIAVRK